jgi:hypothetical protein
MKSSQSRLSGSIDQRPCQRWAFFSVLILSVVSAFSPASAQILYSTGFESPSFAAGSPLAGQDGWIAPPPLSPNAAIVTIDKPRQGKQTVHVPGEDLEHQDFINEATSGYYDAIGSYRRAVNYDSKGTQVLNVSAHVRIDGPETAAGDNFFSASVAAIGLDDNGDPSGVGELAISSDGHVYGYSSQDLVPTFLTSAPITPGEWHNLVVQVSFVTRTYSFFVDDRFLGTFDFDPSATSNILRRGSLIVYTAPDTATLKKENYTAHFDHFSIKVGSE